MAGDISLQCSDCGQDFTFTAADQAFFQERGYSTQKRCKNRVRSRKAFRRVKRLSVPLSLEAHDRLKKQTQAKIVSTKVLRAAT
jgi:hypothetical protein